MSVCGFDGDDDNLKTDFVILIILILINCQTSQNRGAVYEKLSRPLLLRSIWFKKEEDQLFESRKFDSLLL